MGIWSAGARYIVKVRDKLLRDVICRIINIVFNWCFSKHAGCIKIMYNSVRMVNCFFIYNKLLVNIA